MSTFLKTKGDEITKEYHDTVPVRTGRLRNSISGGLQGDLKYVGGATVPYAPFVEKHRGNLDEAVKKGTATMQSDLEKLVKDIFGSSPPTVS